MKVKICGIKNTEEALAITEAGADFIGMVFAPSKRQIDFETAKSITSALKSYSTKTVGVFVNPTEEELKLALASGLDYIQFHGDESVDLVQKYKERAIKAFPSDSVITYKEKFSYPADYILIDSPRKTYYGGSGVTFDWSSLPQAEIDKNRFALAGGLNPGNIKAAIKAARPTLVDVSSGVETNGEKDLRKVKEFINNIRGVENE